MKRAIFIGLAILAMGPECSENEIELEGEGDVDGGGDGDTDTGEFDCDTGGWPHTCDCEECEGDISPCLGFECHDPDCESFTIVEAPYGADLLGYCAPVFDSAEVDPCPPTEFAATPACVLEWYGPSECFCTLIDCTSAADCPPGQGCKPLGGYMVCRP